MQIPHYRLIISNVQVDASLLGLRLYFRTMVFFAGSFQTRVCRPPSEKARAFCQGRPDSWGRKIKAGSLERRQPLSRASRNANCKQAEY